jgi:hypothetical protein
MSLAACVGAVDSDGLPALSLVARSVNRLARAVIAFRPLQPHHSAMAIDRAIDVTGAATHDVTRDAATRHYSFYVGMAVACAATVFSGFAPSFYLRSPALPPLASRAIAHGVGMTCWVLLFLMQTILAATRRMRLHQWLGLAGAALAVLIVVSGVPLALSGARRGIFAGDSIAFLFVILVDLLAFSVFSAAGILLRRRKETHRTFMLLAMVSLLPPAISRWPIAVTHPAIIPAVVLAFVAAIAVRDRLVWNRFRAVSVWGGLALALSLPLRLAVSQTATWHAFARWLVR